MPAPDNPLNDLTGSSSGTSASLLLRIRNPDDAESWLTFESIYGPIIRAYCRRRGFQSSDIDDVSQDVLASVALAIQKFEYEPTRGRFRSWLATITANKLRDFVKNGKSQNEQLVESIERFAASPDSDTEWSAIFMQEIFKTACDRIRSNFEETTWKCFLLTWQELRPPVDVAEELSIPVHSVYINKSRVVKRLEKEFLLLCEDFPVSEK